MKATCKGTIAFACAISHKRIHTHTQSVIESQAFIPLQIGSPVTGQAVCNPSDGIANDGAPVTILQSGSGKRAVSYEATVGWP